MPNILYYNEGVPTLLQLDENDNQVYHGDPTEEALVRLAQLEDLPLELLDTTAELDEEAAILREKMLADFNRLVARSEKSELNPLHVFRLLHHHLKVYKSRKQEKN